MFRSFRRRPWCQILSKACVISSIIVEQYIFFLDSKILNLLGGVFGVGWSAIRENQIDILG